MRARIAWSFVGVASAMIILATLTLMKEMHHHITMFLEDSPGLDIEVVKLLSHIEQAILSSSIWTALGTIVVAIFISFFLANRISSPLIHMRLVAEKMANGDWTSRMQVKGKDELAHLADSLNHLTQQLERQERLRENLTSDIAHELRTPLATLKSHLEAFRDGIWEPTPDRIESCYEEIERLIDLVGDLEQLTSVEAPDFQLLRKNEDLTEIINQCANAMRTAFQEKKIDLTQSLAPLPLISIDKNRVIQIIMNLLSNAFKYTEVGGRVSIQTKDEPNSVQIIIEDTGIGIPKEEVKKVFERFYRVDQSRSRESGGNGIGLTIVKKLVEAHQAFITIDSEVGEGTKVSLTFPKTPKD
ncbi:His Kinase A (phospho-acceptor) domain-containing protein [Seinonella peptonophila]|uniref:histidine kinase n=1 Tax=Seinonella peptonophila TaxID=112248 RepID=A0A1M4Y4Y7_9BACL|nr:ATP-binding protein [Seinonella peptonophila]SHF00821.1 His Kinase A (phospho-acceptor) domain-containing protein [Seinonella peptonophila]